jgi:hypothetical protein
MKYLFVLLIGVILITVGLCLSYKPVKEGMANTDQVMLGGIGPGGLVHTATTGLTGRPNWAAVTGGLTQVSGSLGQMVGVINNSVYYGTQYAVAGSPYAWVQVPGNMIQVDFDYPMVAGVNTSGKIQYIDDVTTSPTTSVFKNIVSTQSFKWVSISIGRGYAIGTDNLIYYTSDVRSGAWVNVSGSIAGKTFLNLSYDGDDVVVLDNANKIYYANSGLETAPNWRQLTGGIKQITMKNHMLFCIGTDNQVYFSPSQTPDASWTLLSSSITFSYLTCFYPRTANMVQQRPALMTPCRSGYTFFGGQCLSGCPSGFTENGVNCNGVPITRATRAATVVPPLRYTCPTGFDVNLSTTATCVSLIDKTTSATQPIREVYSVTGSYTQTEAGAKCATYGGALATLDQITAASAAGAGWCTWGWQAAAGMMAFPVQTTNGCYVDAAPLKVRSQGGGNGKYAANCFGVKPPKDQFPDVQAFNSANQWNQAPPCPFGFNVTTTGTCNSTCPTGSSASGAACIYPVVPKVTAARNNTNYTCPAGYDPPPTVTCSGSNCGATVTCTQSCPAGYTRSGTTCTGPITTKGTVGATRTIVSYSCPAGQTISGSSCLAPCLFGAPPHVDLGSSCRRTVYGHWGMIQEVYNKISTPATPNYSAYSCPASHPTLYPSNGSTCYAGCPAGTNDIGNHQCRPPAVPARLTQNATYAAPCATGFVDHAGQCYQNCPSGSSDIGNNNCQIPNASRTSTTPTQQVSPLTICSSTEDLIGTACVAQCSSDLVSSATTCTAQPVKRDGYAAGYTCNSNETLLNGVCTTKCPEGTYPDGQLCVPVAKVVSIPATIKCTSSPFGNKKKWLCDTAEMATALLKNPTPTTSYIDPEDQICVADDPTTNMYYCESGADAKENTGFMGKVRMNYKATCDNVKKNYMDLSNNITSLLLIQSGMTTGRDQLAAAKTSLDSIYTKLNCANPASAQVTAICTRIQTGATAIGTDSTDIGTVLANITTPIQAAMTSRDSLLASITNFQCSL